MTDLKKLTPRQNAHYTYMMDVMTRLEWDFHNTIEMTGRIPAEWHEIARKTPVRRKVKVNLGLEEDVVKFFRSMGEGYGPRINDVLKSYMHARLAGVIQGAETLAHFRRRTEDFDGPKPPFGDHARKMGDDWEDSGPPPQAPARAKAVELFQRRFAEDGLPDRDVRDLPRV